MCPVENKIKNARICEANGIRDIEHDREHDNRDEAERGFFFSQVPM